MKVVIIIVLFILSSFLCKAQHDLRTKVDSMSNLARRKADLVLSTFAIVKCDRLLYSISNEHYLIVIKMKHSYQQFYVHIDSEGMIKEKKQVKMNRRDREILDQAFDFKSYRKDFVTTVNNPDVTQGNQSYFVVTDIDGNRYGEFFLAVITLPIPIDKKVYNYVLPKLIRQLSK